MLASCGGKDAELLPGNTAQEITDNLEAVQQLVDEQECLDAEDAALQVSTQIEGLEGIDPKLKQALEDGAARLNEVVIDCDEAVELTVEEPETTTTEETAKPDKEEKDAEKEAEKEEKDAEKEAQKEEKEVEKEEPKAPETPEPPTETEESPSGGIGPGAEAGPGAEG